MSVPFYKLSGAGNDFIGLTEPPVDPTSTQIRAWCQRRLSLGADGLFVISRQTGRGDKHPCIRMRHYNADGGRADLCVNGVRCAARLAFELDWARDAATIMTDSGDLVARPAADDQISLTLEAGPWRSRAVEIVADDGSRVSCWHLTVGVPHLVVDWPGDDAEQIPVESLGASLRRHDALGQAGANVDFTIGLSTVELDARDLAVRTFERGVEAETLACGSGVLAVASVAVERYDASFPLTITTRAGHEFVISEQDGRWNLRAHAQLVARGELL